MLSQSQGADNAAFTASIDAVQRVRASRSANATPAYAIDPDEQPQVNSSTSSFVGPNARFSDFPSSVIKFFDLQPPIDSTRVDTVVNRAIGQLLNAQTDAQKMAIAAQLRHTLANDQGAGFYELTYTKRRVANELADLHQDDELSLPDQHTFDAYMMVLRSLETLMERIEASKGASPTG